MMCFVFDLPVTLSGEERGFPIEGFLSLFVSIIYNDIGDKSYADSYNTVAELNITYTPEAVN